MNNTKNKHGVWFSLPEPESLMEQWRAAAFSRRVRSMATRMREAVERSSVPASVIASCEDDLYEHDGEVVWQVAAACAADSGWSLSLHTKPHAPPHFVLCATAAHVRLMEGGHGHDAHVVPEMRSLLDAQDIHN